MVKEKVYKNNEQKKEKYFYSQWWFWTIIVFLIAVNFLLLLWKTSNLSNILAIISGWISGIATIFVGVIATRQNKKYKNDNDENNRKQEELIKKQHDYDVFKSIIQVRIQFIDNIKNQTNNFINDFNFRKVTALLVELETLRKYKKNDCENEINNFNKFVSFEELLDTAYLNLTQMLDSDWLKNNKNKEFKKALENYYSALIEFISDIDYSDLQKLISDMNVKMSRLYLELLRTKNNYVTFLDVDVNKVLLTKSEDLEFLKHYYSYSKEEKNNG